MRERRENERTLRRHDDEQGRVEGGWGLWLINRKPRANKLIAEYELTEFGKSASLLLSFFQRPQGHNLFLSFSTLLIWTFFRLTHVHSLQNMAKSTSYSAYNCLFAALRSPVFGGFASSNQTNICDLLEAKSICFFLCHYLTVFLSFLPTPRFHV